ncbi:proline-rich protein 36-like [Zingiber officinale]|uniref:proline-rich protein 36-like n=1 Tax=Zingiber officinale TaxID=94328 RepID=UPI001C4CCC75|nr:proline-rich protein 36-like [Zingiber officinale]
MAVKKTSTKFKVSTLNNQKLSSICVFTNPTGSQKRQLMWKNKWHFLLQFDQRQHLLDCKFNPRVLGDQFNMPRLIELSKEHQNCPRILHAVIHGPIILPLPMPLSNANTPFLSTHELPSVEASLSLSTSQTLTLPSSRASLSYLVDPLSPRRFPQPPSPPPLQCCHLPGSLVASYPPSPPSSRISTLTTIHKPPLPPLAAHPDSAPPPPLAACLDSAPPPATPLQHSLPFHLEAAISGTPCIAPTAIEAHRSLLRLRTPHSSLTSAASQVMPPSPQTSSLHISPLSADL